MQTDLSIRIHQPIVLVAILAFQLLYVSLDKPGGFGIRGAYQPAYQSVRQQRVVSDDLAVPQPLLAPGGDLVNLQLGDGLQLFFRPVLRLIDLMQIDLTRSPE